MVTHEQVLVVVATLWSSPPWSPEAQAMFLEDIRTIPADAALAAVRRFYSTDPGGFRPTPGKLRAILEPRDRLAGERAWASVLLAVRYFAGRPTHETPDMPQFGDPRTADALRAIGGFRQFLGGIDAKDAEWTRTRFLRAYERGGERSAPQLDAGRVNALDGRGPAPEQLRSLLGRAAR